MRTLRQGLQSNFPILFSVILLFSIGAVSVAQTAATGAAAITRDQIDPIVQQALARTGVPSASVAVVKDGKTVFTQTYGDAKLEPRTPARPEMRYGIGSISKQFTAAAVMMMVEQGKLSLDDKVAKFFPRLTRAEEVSIRQLLSHTSGYQDYWPQDYVFAMMMQPTTADQIMDRWARKPLDYDPGTKWQYSNTGYVIAGAIVEKVSGMPLFQLLTERVFKPLGMTSVTDIDQGRLANTDPTGYMRYALGPPRTAPKEGKGWLFAAGGLAMTASDLAKWDVATIEQRVLKPASYKAMQTDTLLNSGVATGYGLGLTVRQSGGRRTLEHGGEVSGFTAENIIFPDDRAAIVVLTNQDAAGASGQIAQRIAPLLFPSIRSTNAAKERQIRTIFEGLQQGKIDRSLFTENCSAYFTEQALADFAASLGPLGSPQEFTQSGQQDRGGMTFRGYRVRVSSKTLSVTVREMPDGKIEQYQIAAVE